MIKRNKVLFVYEQGKEYKIESLWGEKKSEGLYKIDNIPFFIQNISLGDIVSVENDEGELYFESLIEESGNSTIQLIVLKDGFNQKSIGVKFEDLNCSWEGSHRSNYLSINIPKEVDFHHISNLLKKGLNKGDWDYREACISAHHRNSK